MMINIPTFNKLLSALFVLLIVAGFTYTKSSSHKIGYVIIQELFNDFEYKKELQKKLESIKTIRLKIADSLRLDLTLLSRKLQSGNATVEEKKLFDSKSASYIQHVKQYEEENVLLTKEYDAQIITQLNQYVSDYGKQNNYDMIHGNNSDGSLMYGRDALNITADVKKFINNKYKGIN